MSAPGQSSKERNSASRLIAGADSGAADGPTAAAAAAAANCDPATVREVRMDRNVSCTTIMTPPSARHLRSWESLAARCTADRPSASSRKHFSDGPPPTWLPISSVSHLENSCSHCEATDLGTRTSAVGGELGRDTASGAEAVAWTYGSPDGASARLSAVCKKAMMVSVLPSPMACARTQPWCSAPSLWRQRPRSGREGPMHADHKKRTPSIW
mmetsp:Transcript_9765/g.29782  ORF Transcript_9765/g.29782 Transcript_9765/m.29782 type:complete len:213 (-) Transcript_9765:3819-4457(-)